MLFLMVTHRPEQNQAVIQYQLKSTLRKLSLKAVLEHKNHLILSRVGVLKNLRKKYCRSM
jgi:hypothetical protein